jgi:hypothetical protein
MPASDTDKIEAASWYLFDDWATMPRNIRYGVLDRLSNILTWGERLAKAESRGNADDNYAKLQTHAAAAERERDEAREEVDALVRNKVGLTEAVEALEARVARALEALWGAPCTGTGGAGRLRQSTPRLADSEPAGRQEGLEARLARALEALQLPLIFFTGGPMTTDQLDTWRAITGQHDVTSKVMCDVIRRALADSEPAAGQIGDEDAPSTS